MNIDWDEAPEWANYAAMDEDGSWWWYEAMPHTRPNGAWFVTYGDAFIAANTERRNQDWRKSLVKRGELTSVESPATLNALDNDYFL